MLIAPVYCKQPTNLLNGFQSKSKCELIDVTISISVVNNCHVTFDGLSKFYVTLPNIKNFVKMQIGYMIIPSKKSYEKIWRQGK
jgi:hypothetical protein